MTIRETVNAHADQLRQMDQPALTAWAKANGMDSRSARSLGELAQRYGVVLTVEHVRGFDNPADRYTVTSGFQKWQDTDLRGLIDPT